MSNDCCHTGRQAHSLHAHTRTRTRTHMVMREAAGTRRCQPRRAKAKPKHRTGRHRRRTGRQATEVSLRTALQLPPLHVRVIPPGVWTRSVPEEGRQAGPGREQQKRRESSRTAGLPRRACLLRAEGDGWRGVVGWLRRRRGQCRVASGTLRQEPYVFWYSSQRPLDKRHM